MTTVNEQQKVTRAIFLMLFYLCYVIFTGCLKIIVTTLLSSLYRTTIVDEQWEVTE